MGGFLTKIFSRNAALLGGAALMAMMSAGCSTFFGHNVEILLSPGAPLTSGEKEIAYNFFGDQLNIPSIRKHFFNDNCGTADSAFMTAGNNIAACTADVHSNDYSRASAKTKAKFIHELTHIFQFQTLLSQTNGLCIKEPVGGAVYIYDKNKQKFSDYCHEQQGAIIEDYVLRFLMPPQEMALSDGAHATYSHKVWEASRWNEKDTPETDAFLQKIVEDQFPQARKMRLEEEARRTAAGDPLYLYPR